MTVLIPGVTGDDFLVLGLRNSSLVYSYNLGSGMATITSEPLDLTHRIHTVSLGRFLRNGWMKVSLALKQLHLAIVARTRIVAIMLLGYSTMLLLG